MKRNYSAWRRVSLSCSQELPPVSMLETGKSWARGAEGKQFSQPELDMGTPRDRYRCRTLPFSALWCEGHIWRQSSVEGITAGSWDKTVQPLKQLARDQSQELSYKKDLRWSWNTRKCHESLLFVQSQGTERNRFPKKLVYQSFKLETGRDPTHLGKTCKIPAKYKPNYKKLWAGAPLTCNTLDWNGSVNTGGIEVSWLVHEGWSHRSIITDGEKPAFSLMSANRWIRDFLVREDQALFNTNKNLRARLKAKVVLNFFQ